MPTRQTHKRIFIALCLVLTLLSSNAWHLRPIHAAPPAILLVTSTGDTQIGDAGCADGCSLREAIATANAGDEIRFSSLFDTPQTITLGGTELWITKNLTISGPGAKLLTISGNQASRVLNISSINATSVMPVSLEFQGPTVTLKGLKIANGKISGGGTSNNAGGGILNNDSVLTLTNCVISDNTITSTEYGSWDGGGGLFNSGFVTMESCTISHNLINGQGGFSFGGGLFNFFGGLKATGSTFSGNEVNSTTQAFAGAICNGCTFRVGITLRGNSGFAELTNCTISGNSLADAGAQGAGIYTEDELTLTNCTITGNKGYYGSGIFNHFNSSGMKVKNTIIAGNIGYIGSPGDSPDVNGVMESQGHNLIGTNANNNFVDGNNGDKVGTLAAPLDPKLAPLDDNGGPTQTHALLPDSPALNAGDNCVTQTPGCLTTPLTTDQRGTGFPRQVGTNVDIGAFEFGNAAPSITAQTLSQMMATSATGVLIATVNDTDNQVGSLTVTVNSSTTATVNNVTVSNLANSSGRVTANITASCAAADAMFTLTVSDGTLSKSVSLTVNVSPETTPPETNITGTPPSTSEGNVSFSFTGYDNCTVASFECRLDNGGWSTCTSPKSYSNLAEGQHLFEVRAKDAQGNVDSSPAQYPWLVFASSCGTVVSPATLPAAKRGTPFVQTLSASPTGSYVFTLVTGNLPPGVSLVNTLGIYSLRGTPTTTGTYTFTIKASKSNSTCMGARPYTLVVQ
ncbi:MAG: choice-of-anchor Q domain-containing protein [Blastocatellia bacterium]